MNSSLMSRVRLPRVIALIGALFLPVLAFADWTLPYSPVTSTYYSIQWTGSAPSNAPAVVIWAQAPGSSSWAGFGSAGVSSYGQVNLSASYSFSSAGTWGLKVETVGTGTPTVVALTSIYVGPNIPDSMAPSIPGTPTTTGVAYNYLSLTWSASTDNVGVTGYEVFLNGSSAALVSTNSAALTGLSPSTSYYLQVRARDAAGNWSPLSAACYVTTPAAPTTVYINGWTLPGNPVVGQSYSIAWQGYSSGASYVMLYYKAPGSSTWVACGSGGGPSGGGTFSATGGWGASTAGTYEFAVAPGGTAPTSSSASIVVH